MREKIARFMMGRYGVDAFSRFLMVITIVFMNFAGPILYFLLGKEDA